MPDVLALVASALQVSSADLTEDDGTETMPGWDSLKIILLACMIEVTYDITLDSSEIEQLTTVRAVREVLASHARG
jgi:acyl carrier protein